MSVTISGSIRAGTSAECRNTTSGARAVVGEAADLRLNDSPAEGSTDTEVDRIVSCIETRELSDGASETIDLYDLGGFDVGAGPGRDNLGLAGNTTKLVFLQIVTELLDDDDDETPLTGDLLVGGEGSAAAWNTLFNGDDNAILRLPPGSQLQIATKHSDAFAVADTSNHLLKVEADGGKVRYRIHFGERA